MDSPRKMRQIQIHKTILQKQAPSKKLYNQGEVQTCRGREKVLQKNKVSSQRIYIFLEMW